MPAILLSVRESAVTDLPQSAFAAAGLAGLFDAHAADLLAYLTALTADAALSEDALQDVFLRLARRPGILKHIDTPRAFLFRMARNEGLRLLERDKNRRNRENTAPVPPRLEPRPEGGLPAATAAALEQALLQLPDEQRETVFLKCVEGFTLEQIAGLTGTGRDTAASRYRYGIEKLRLVMGAD